MGDDVRVGLAFLGVAEPEPQHVPLVELDHRRRGKGRLHRGGVTDRCDHVGRAVRAAVEQEGVADAQGSGGGDDPLILHLNGFRARAPHRVQDRLDVLLVDDEVVGRRVPGEPALGVALSVVERDNQTGPVHGHQTGVDRERVGALGQRGERSRRVAAVMIVDLVDEAFALRGQSVDRRLCIPDQVDEPGASLRRISLPPDTVWVVANNNPAQRQTTGTPKRHRDRPSRAIVSPPRTVLR